MHREVERALRHRAGQHQHLRAHARRLRAHVDELADKQYWAHLADSPEFVVLFLPGEAFLAPALEHDPDLLEPRTFLMRPIVWSRR